MKIPFDCEYIFLMVCLLLTRITPDGKRCDGWFPTKITTQYLLIHSSTQHIIHFSWGIHLGFLTIWRYLPLLFEARDKFGSLIWKYAVGELEMLLVRSTFNTTIHTNLWISNELLLNWMIYWAKILDFCYTNVISEASLE